MLKGDAVLCSDEASAYWTSAKKKQITLRQVPANPRRKRRDPIYQVQNVNAYDSRLKGWMFQFRGVATKHLPEPPGLALPVGQPPCPTHAT